MARRGAITRAAVVAAAVRVADRGGVAAMSMRNVGQELGVEAMSLYHHVAGKDAMIDAVVDWVFTQIEAPDPEASWREAMAARAASARRALSAHPWALGLIESRRTPGPALLHHHESVLANLRRNGFPVALAAHAFSAIDSYVYGFVLTELNLPFGGEESGEDFVAEFRDALPQAAYPHLVELVTEHVAGREYAYGDEFEFGLDLILDGLAGHLAEASGSGHVR